MIKFIVVLSFMLDGLLSIYQETSIFDFHLFRTMFTITAIVIIFPKYFKRNDMYYKTCLLLGFFYDILYTNTPFLNMLVFPLLGFLVYRLYIFLSDNILNSIIINVIILIMYSLITFTVLFLIGYLSFDISILTKYIIEIILINSIYFIIGYIFVNNFKGFKKSKSKYSL